METRSVSEGFVEFPSLCLANASGFPRHDIPFMSATKQAAPPPRWRTWFILSIRRLIAYSVWAGVTIGLSAAAVYALWSHVRPQVITGPHYRLDLERIALQPAPPAWIRGDLRGEALRSASLDDQTQCSILDADLAERVYKAFALHPWVAKVERVTKLNPSGVRVEVVYRRPVCMVEVPGGLYAVDADAYLLPSSDFAPDDVKQYPRLADLPTATAGPVGTQWQDPHVHEAARIAAALVEHWQSLSLVRISLTPRDARRMPKREEYDLFTTKGTCIRWGTADNDRLSGEPSLVKKVERLRQFAERNGSLDVSTGPMVLDLRQGPEISVQPLALAIPETAAPVVPVSRQQ